MIRVFFLVTLLLPICYNAYSVDNDTLEFVGFLETGNKDFITYKIKFSYDDNGQLTGESFSDFYGHNFTRSRITGEINKNGKRISYKEVENISTKSKAEERFFCYVHIDNVKIRSIKGESILTGDFQGYYSDGRPCVGGKINLVSISVIELLQGDMNQDATELDELNRVDSIMVSQNKKDKIKEFLKKETVSLYHDEELSLKWESDSVIIEIWDNHAEDGDVISIWFGDDMLSEKFLIRNNKSILRLPLSKKDSITVLKITAVNTGMIPPNTVYMNLIDGALITPLVSNLGINQSVKIKFRH